MKIGIDIDDTMTDSSELIIKNAMSFFETDDINLINETLNSKIEGKLSDFYYEYLPIMMPVYKLKDSVKEVIDRLRANGHEVIVITARGHTIQAGLIDITKEYFNKHNIIVDKMIFGAIEKVEECLNNNIDIMIDDSVSVCERLNNNNIKSLVFNSVSNMNFDTNIDRINNWIELEEYINRIL